MIINEIYKNLKLILNNNIYFRKFSDQRGGSSDDNGNKKIKNDFFINELHIKNYEYYDNIIKYMILYQIIDMIHINELQINDSLINDLKEQIYIDINGYNINEINDKIQKLLINILTNNIFYINNNDNNISYISLIDILEIDKFDNFCLKNDLLEYIYEFQFIENKDTNTYDLLNTLEKLILIDDKIHNNILLNINIIYNKFTELIEDENLNYNIINIYNKNIYLIYLLLNYTKKIEINVMKVNENEYNYVFIEFIKYYNYVLYEEINKYYKSFSIEKSNEIDKFIKKLIIDESINDNKYDFVNDIITFIENINIDKNNSFEINNNEKLYFKYFFNIINNINIEYSDLFINYMLKYINIRENALNIDNINDNDDTNINIVNEIEFYDWYINDKTDFEKLNIEDININNIYNFFSNELNIIKTLTPLQFKLLINIFNVYDTQINFLINVINFDVYIDLNELYDVYFYVFENKYKHYFNEIDIVFMRENITNLIYLNSNPLYFYEYIKSHGGGKYINKIDNLLLANINTNEKIKKIGNIEIQQFNSLNCYMYIINKIGDINNNEYSNLKFINKLIYKSYLDLNYIKIINENKDNIIKIIYNYIYIFYNSFEKFNYLNTTNKLDYSYFENKIIKQKIPLKINNNTTIFNFMDINEEIIKIFEKYIKIDFNDENNIYIKKINNFEFLKNEIEKKINISNIELSLVKDNIILYTNNITDIKQKLDFCNNLLEYSKKKKEEKELNINNTIENKIIEINEYIDEIKTKNNYNEIISNYNIILNKKTKAELFYNENYLNYNLILKQLKENFIYAKNEGGITDININMDTEITDELIGELYKLSKKSIENIENINEYDLINTETPFTILEFILDKVNENKIILKESKDSLDKYIIKLQKEQLLIDNINNIYNEQIIELEKLKLYNINIQTELEKIDLLNTELYKNEEKLNNLTNNNDEIIKDINLLNEENTILIEQLNSLKDYTINQKNIFILNKINKFILDNYDINNNLHNEINNYIIYLLKKNEIKSDILLLYKSLYYLKDIRIIIYDEKNGELLNFYEIIKNNDIDFEDKFNIYLYKSKENELYNILYLDIYKININNLNLNLDTELINKLYYVLENNYLLLNKIKIKNKNYDLLYLNKMKIINKIRKINVKKNVNIDDYDYNHTDNIIKKIIKILKFNTIYIIKNTNSLYTFYKLLFYFVLNHINDLNKDTLFKLKYYILLLINIKDKNINFKILNKLTLIHITIILYDLDINILNTNENHLNLKELRINKLEKDAVLEDINVNTNLYSVINEFNNILGNFYTSEEINGNYRFIIEKYFRTKQGFEELKYSNKLKDFQIIDINNNKIKSNEMLIQLSSEIIYMSLYPDYILFLYPLDLIKEYYINNIFIRYSPELTDDIKNALIRTEYYLVNKIMYLSKIEFIDAEEDIFIRDYFDIINELHIGLKQLSKNMNKNPDEFYKEIGDNYIIKINKN